jgi:GNAT superfamily N-acetyltransferase
MSVSALPVATSQSPWILRAASAGDVEDIAAVWHRGWRDGHLGHVPADLLSHRGQGDFRQRVPARLAHTTVATIDSRVVGFATVHDDELEQIYVDESARGGGVAAALLRQAEAVIGSRFDVAWLAVVAGNARALRFYARCGWSDAGAIDYAAETATGRFTVPSRRYEKRLRRDGRGPSIESIDQSSV